MCVSVANALNFEVCVLSAPAVYIRHCCIEVCILPVCNSQGFGTRTGMCMYLQARCALYTGIHHTVVYMLYTHMDPCMQKQYHMDFCIRKQDLRFVALHFRMQCSKASTAELADLHN